MDSPEQELEIIQPKGNRQKCTACGNMAVASIYIKPDEVHANQVSFHLCHFHANEMIGDLIPLSDDHGTQGWRWDDNA